ncbi:hypothetical protein ABK905_18235 [Acerihabitans sp. KWT182]|uniref:Uncharacterized protein n=1 Tax=Acerihabitans sp. KWT182 TaxID=3157919 RepID=A0AAU7Q6N3_9GAMM
MAGLKKTIKSISLFLRRNIPIAEINKAAIELNILPKYNDVENLKSSALDMSIAVDVNKYEVGGYTAKGSVSDTKWLDHFKSFIDERDNFNGAFWGNS